MGTGLPGTATSAAYVDLLNRTQPDGPYWPTADSLLTDMHEALSVELARLHNRTNDMLEESDPRTTDELLSEWETVLGLDPIGTTAERRAAAAAALIATGGNSAAYFEQLADRMGMPTLVILDQVSAPWTLWTAASPPCAPLRSAYDGFLFESHGPVGATAAQRAAWIALVDRIKPLHTHVHYYWDV